jgi:hypothetical protein
MALIVAGFGVGSGGGGSTFGVRALSFNSDPQEEHSTESGAGVGISTRVAHLGQVKFFMISLSVYGKNIRASYSLWLVRLKRKF